MTKGFFVEDTKENPFAFLIAAGYKTIETRNRNMLSALVGENVAIIRTRKGKAPEIVGYVDVVDSFYCHAEDFRKYYTLHRVREGSKYDCTGKGKWCYFLSNPRFLLKPYPLPEWTVRHGRSWCEF